MAHTKAQRAVRGNRDSRSKRRGVKMYGGQVIKSGNIIVRQKGSRFFPGEGVLEAKDYTIMATRDGVVKFHTLRGKQFVSVIAAEAPAKASKKAVKKTADTVPATTIDPETEKVVLAE